MLPESPYERHLRTAQRILGRLLPRVDCEYNQRLIADELLSAQISQHLNLRSICELSRVMPEDDRMKYAINEIDKPLEHNVSMLFTTITNHRRYKYIAPEMRGFSTKSNKGATSMMDFGFVWKETGNIVTFKRIFISCAQYPDGPELS